MENTVAAVQNNDLDNERMDVLWWVRNLGYTKQQSCPIDPIPVLIDPNPVLVDPIPVLIDPIPVLLTRSLSYWPDPCPHWPDPCPRWPDPCPIDPIPVLIDPIPVLIDPIPVLLTRSLSSLTRSLSYWPDPCPHWPDPCPHWPDPCPHWPDPWSNNLRQSVWAVSCKRTPLSPRAALNRLVSYLIIILQIPRKSRNMPKPLVSQNQCYIILDKAVKRLRSSKTNLHSSFIAKKKTAL